MVFGFIGNSNQFFRVVENWNFDEECVPYFLVGLVNLTRSDDKMKICQELGDEGIFEAYNKYVGPYLTNHCYNLCEKLSYVGSMQAIIPESAPIEVCYWLRSKDVTYSEEYFIYDFKVIVGSIGGTMGLFLGFSFYDNFKHIINYVKTWFFVIHNVSR